MLLLIILLITEIVKCTTFTEPVNTTNGLVRGIFAEDGDYSMYLGIPYAKVNEANPFGESVPYPHFDGVFDANDENRICPQFEDFRKIIIGTLDCLNLNIYVPNKSKSGPKLPVLAYVYGGKFSNGHATRFVYGPKFIVKHDIILVLFNYRVGPYGFMCLDTEDVPGNQGFKDQYSAIKWIYENIASFGGDVDKITLLGSSSGAMSVDFHLLSERPKFYKQAILQSGSALVPSIISPSDYTAPLKIAEHLGYTTNHIQEAISFLASTHSDFVIAATRKLGITFRPCVEKSFDKVDRFINMHPEHKNVSNITNIKILAGFDSDEDLAPNITETMFSDRIMLDFNITDMQAMINRVKTFYIGDGMINETEYFRDLIAFASDYTFINPVQRSIVRYLKSGLQVYQYMFAYSGGRNYGKIKTNTTNEGVMHSDELGYLFNVSFILGTPSVEDEIMIDKMTTMWTNFVKFGNPTPTTSNLLPVTWIPANKDVIWYLKINFTPVMEKRPYHARLSFWDLFYAANQENLLANVNFKPCSTGSRLSLSIMLIPVWSLAIYL